MRIGHGVESLRILDKTEALNPWKFPSELPMTSQVLSQIVHPSASKAKDFSTRVVPKIGVPFWHPSILGAAIYLPEGAYNLEKNPLT